MNDSSFYPSNYQLRKNNSRQCVNIRMHLETLPIDTLYIKYLMRNNEKLEKENKILSEEIENLVAKCCTCKTEGNDKEEMAIKEEKIDGKYGKEKVDIT